MASSRVAAVMPLCPQCRAALGTERAEDGRLFRRCPRCGWHDRDTGGAGTPASNEILLEQARALRSQRRRKSAARTLLSLIIWAAIIGGVLYALWNKGIIK
jgi:hypothetical protein